MYIYRLSAVSQNNIRPQNTTPQNEESREEKDIFYLNFYFTFLPVEVNTIQN